MKLDILSKIPEPAAKFLAKQAFNLKAQSPKIFLVAGIIGVGVSTVMACKATLKVSKVAEARKDDIEQTRLLKHDMEPAAYRKEIAKKSGLLVMDLAKVYWPAVTIGIFSVSSIIYSHKIMENRNLMLAGAYTALEQTFNKYRENVISEHGENADRDARYGIKKDTIKTEENGTKKTEKVYSVDTSSRDGMYTAFFDNMSPNFDKDDPEYNKMFLIEQQNYANDLLKRRGYLFLSDVLNSLGLPETDTSRVTGWVLGNGDDYVDFGIFIKDNEANRRFVNGIEPVILLNFNCDGFILDKIGNCKR